MTAEVTPGKPDDWRDEVRSDFAGLRDGRPSAGDLPDLLIEVDRLRRWKAEATEVILGLQDLGKALQLSPGLSITGRTAAEAARRLTARAEAAEAEVREREDWSNELAMLLPEDAETWPGVNPEGAQESIITACLTHLLAKVAAAEALADEGAGATLLELWNNLDAYEETWAGVVTDCDPGNPFAAGVAYCLDDLRTALSISRRETPEQGEQ